MGVHFTKEQMEQAIQNHENWWDGKLDRPLVKVIIYDAYCAERKSPAPMLSQRSCSDFTWSPEQLIEALDEELSQYEYLGDAFPFVNFDSFGPGVLSAFCGAKLDNSSGSVWFFPEKKAELSDIHIRYNPESVWVKRIKAIYRAGLSKWNGCVAMGLPDLGGVLDVAAVFRGSEELLMDLYDAPEEVQRLCGEVQTAWYEAYQDFFHVLAPQKCNTNWSGLLSVSPSYILQSDFTYMIGNQMFRKFALETLREDTKRLPHTIYHLDGVGELNHLDDILRLEDLNAVQWIYGDGKPSAMHWMDVYKTIQAAGKQMMVIGSPEDYLAVLGEVHGTPYAGFALRSTERDMAAKLMNAR